MCAKPGEKGRKGINGGENCAKVDEKAENTGAKASEKGKQVCWKGVSDRSRIWSRVAPEFFSEILQV